MITPALFMRAIKQKDNHTFTIEWNDGNVADYRLADLQRACPCAGCWDIENEKQLIDPTHVPDNLSAVKITNVGRYAIRIQFTSGCSNGIFGFDFLYEKGKK